MYSSHRSCPDFIACTCKRCHTSFSPYGFASSAMMITDMPGPSVRASTTLRISFVCLLSLPGRTVGSSAPIAWFWSSKLSFPPEKIIRMCFRGLGFAVLCDSLHSSPLLIISMYLLYCCSSSLNFAIFF